MLERCDDQRFASTEPIAHSCCSRGPHRHLHHHLTSRRCRTVAVSSSRCCCTAAWAGADTSTYKIRGTRAGGAYQRRRLASAGDDECVRARRRAAYRFIASERFRHPSCASAFAHSRAHPPRSRLWCAPLTIIHHQVKHYQLVKHSKVKSLKTGPISTRFRLWYLSINVHLDPHIRPATVNCITVRTHLLQCGEN